MVEPSMLLPVNMWDMESPRRNTWNTTNHWSIILGIRFRISQLTFKFMIILNLMLNNEFGSVCENPDTMHMHRIGWFVFMVKLCPFPQYSYCQFIFAIHLESFNSKLFTLSIADKFTTSMGARPEEVRLVDSLQCIGPNWRMFSNSVVYSSVQPQKLLINQTPTLMSFTILRPLQPFHHLEQKSIRCTKYLLQPF